MAVIKGRATLEASCTVTLSEAEMKALDALVGYGFDLLIKTFKKNLGESYMQGNEKGLEEFFRTVAQTVPGILKRAEEARDVFIGLRQTVPRSPSVRSPAVEWWRTQRLNGG